MKNVLTIFIYSMVCLQGWAQTKPVKNQKNGKIDFVITHVPNYNTFGFVEGKIIGDLNLKEYRIACYLFSEDGGGYFNKPYWSSPTSGISGNATFMVNVTTGGTDEKATAYALFLVPASYDPPILRGGKIPVELFKMFPYIRITREPK